MGLDRNGWSYPVEKTFSISIKLGVLGIVSFLLKSTPTFRITGAGHTIMTLGDQNKQKTDFPTTSGITYIFQHQISFRPLSRSCLELKLGLQSTRTSMST